MVCNALVACGRLLGAEQQAVRPGRMAITQVQSRAPDDRHISARNMLSRLYVQKSIQQHLVGFLLYA